jgi:sortase (surface protein transpeptidase)
MAGQTKGRRTASNVLIAIGAIVLLGTAGAFLWSQYQGARLRAELQQTPTPASSAVNTAPSAQPAPAGTAPTELPPTSASSPTAARPSPTVPASTAAAPTPEAAQPTASLTTPVAPTAVPAAAPASAPAGPPVRLVAADLGIDVPVVEMAWEAVQTAQGTQTEWVIPENEAGHHIDSAQLGESGNLVISGHNNIYGRVFERISLAWPGKASKVDDITERSDILNGRTLQLYNQAGQRFDYVITDFLRLKDTGVPLAQRVENARYMRPTDDTRLTLVTCWPPWSNTHRLIVIAAAAQQP